MSTLVEQSRAVLDWPEVVSRLVAEARSDRGREACAALPLASTAAEAAAWVADVAELVRLLRAQLTLPGLAFPEIEPFLVAAGKQLILGPDDIRPIAEVCDVADGVRRFFDRLDPEGPLAAPLLTARASGLDPCRALAAEIRETFDAAGEIRDSVSPELARLRRERESLAGRVRSEIETLMRGDEFAGVLQDEFVTIRSDRYVLPVKASAKSLGLGIVHDTSRTGETVFLEPTAVVGMNNRLKLAELEIQRETRRILKALSERVAEASSALRMDVDILAAFDVLTAKARLAVAYQGHALEIVDEEVLELTNARHPLLVLRSAREGFPVIGNDVWLGAGRGDPAAGPARVLVVSGPNAGGKTVLLKTVGLAALLARAGMLIPAEPGGRVGFFDLVMADIGDQQSVQGDLSTFSAHLANLAAILQQRQSGQRVLVLLDEIMAGTNPEQGAALARATAETVADGAGLAVITTHYDALKALAEKDTRFRNAGMEYDSERLAPTFRLKDGTPGRSYAFDIAARMGLPQGLLDRARELAGDATVGIEQVLATLQAREEALARETVRLEEARQELTDHADDQRAAIEALEKRERELARHSREAIEAAVREARDAIRAIVRQAQQAGSSSAAEEARRALSVTARAALDALPEEPIPDRPPIELSPGAWVFLPSMGANAVVARAPDARGRLKVNIGALGVEVDAAEVLPGRRGEPLPSASRFPAGAPRREPVARQEQSQEEVTLALTSPSARNTLDLRGQRADEALDAIEPFLDSAALEGRSPVFVIHGHGTGTLKKVIREYLNRSPYVRRWTPGSKAQGGDGVSVIEL